jgi:predicted glycosyltransferase
MHGHMMHFFKDVEHKIENKGEELVITFKGDKNQLAKMEKVMRAMKDLHEACGEDCCHDGKCC